MTGITLPGLSTGPELPGLQSMEVLADQRLRARLAGGVLVELAEAALVDRDRDHRLTIRSAAPIDAGLGKIDARDRPGGDSGHLDVRADDQAERVVEPNLVGAVGALVRSPGGQDDERPGDEQDGGAEEDALHLPVGTSLGVHG